ncbi:hypothetical protein ACSLOE_30475, partial [Escherichia coli]|uniref:hypothetical protein n=1 Tax=Escherichia coli TaxID=562 RepID=UPI003EE40849
FNSSFKDLKVDLLDTKLSSCLAIRAINGLISFDIRSTSVRARQEIGQAKTLAEAMAKHKTNLEKALSIESALVKTTPDVTAI